MRNNCEGSKSTESRELVLGTATTTDRSPSSERAAECEQYVEISGAVITPGVYCFDSGALVNDAIAAAGGYNAQAYAYKYVIQHLNLAEQLSPNLKIYIPFQDDVVCQKVAEVENPSGTKLLSTEKNLSDTNLKEAVCVSINNATLEELDSLSGIGPSTAQKIINGRPFDALEDLLDVSGIGDSTFEKIESEICL